MTDTRWEPLVARLQSHLLFIVAVRASRSEDAEMNDLSKRERSRADKGTSLEFAVCRGHTLFRPHPQPLSHSVGEGSRALTCLEC